MNIKSHVVAETVRHKEASDAVSGKLSRVTGDKASSLQSFEHLGNSRDMNLAIGDAGTNHREGKLIATVDEVVDFFLLRGELSAARVGTREVGGIVDVALGTGIHHKETSRSDYLVMGVVVQSLTVLRENCGERHAPALREGNALHPPDNLLFKHTGTASLACNRVHLDSEVAGIVNRLYFTVLLNKAH